MSSERSIVDGLFIWNEWLIIPSVLQKQVLEQIHIGHQDIGKCSERARQTVFMPGLLAELEELSPNDGLVA